MKAFKLHVTSPEQSEEVQKILFEQGYKWCGTGKRVACTDQRYIFSDMLGNMTSGYSDHHFQDSIYPELKLN